MVGGYYLSLYSYIWSSFAVLSEITCEGDASEAPKVTTCCQIQAGRTKEQWSQRSVWIFAEDEDRRLPSESYLFRERRVSFGYPSGIIRPVPKATVEERFLPDKGLRKRMPRKAGVDMALEG